MPSATDRIASFSDKLRRRLEIVASTELDRRDQDYMIDVLVLRTALLYDLLDGSTQAECTANWERTLLGLRSLDVGLYTSDWKVLREILTSIDFRILAKHAIDDIDATIEAFKLAASGRIHYKWILNSAVWLMKEDETWFSKVNQWVVFDSRVNLASLNLSAQCCAEYLSFEENLPDPDHYYNTYCDLVPAYDTVDDVEAHDALSAMDGSTLYLEDLPNLEYRVRYGTPEEQNILRCLQRVAQDLFGKFRITDYPFRPKHGNGATAEVSRADADPWHKNRHFAVDGEIIQYLRYRVSEEEWQDWFYLPYRGLDRTCELVCVPKSTTKNRTISKEPTTLQYLQQDIALALDDFYRENPDLGIDLHCQDKSRELALVGSSDGSYATIDSSSASDSVTVAIVEWLFGDLEIYYPLMATRSTHVHVACEESDLFPAQDTVVELRKFAPMGSCTCFHVETIVFTIACEAAVRLDTGRKSRKNDYRVYGDDVVIRTRFVTTLLKILDLLGFIVNHDKSFGLDPALDEPESALVFREACGIEALDGVDITPLRLSRRLVSVTNNDSDHQAGLGVGFVDLLNRAYLRGYWHLRRWLNDQLVKHMWYRTCLRLAADDYRRFSVDILNKRKSSITVAIPYVITDETSATQWRAFGAKSSLLSRYQRCSALVTTARTRGPRVLHHDENDYFSWCLRAKTQPIAEDEFIIDDTGIVTIRPRDLKWSKTWVSLQRPALLQQRSPR